MVKVKVKEIPKSKVNPDELNFIDEHHALEVRDGMMRVYCFEKGDRVRITILVGYKK